MTSIQLRRQGVSQSLHGHFAPCPHGHPWHIAVDDYQGNCWRVELCYPNCHACHGQKTPRPEWPSAKYKTTNAGHAKYSKDLLAWHNSDHSGQVAWSNRSTYTDCTTRDAAKTSALAHIRKTVGFDVEFAQNIEAYCYNTAHECRIWPQVAADIYVLACSFEPATNTIRHEPTNVCLIAFDGPTAARFDVDRAAVPYRAQIDEAYGEFLKSHNQRMGEYDAKCWLAWLLSEYIKGNHADQRPVRRKYVSRDGTGAFAGPECLHTAVLA